MSVRGTIVARMGFVYYLTVAFGLLVLGAIFHIQFFEAGKWLKLEQSSFRNKIIIPIRGDIRARDGRLLASSVPDYEIRMDLMAAKMPPSLLKLKIDTLAGKLSGLFKDKSYQDYKRALLSASFHKSRYFLIHRNVAYKQLKQLKTFPLFRMGQFKGGLIIHSKTIRMKPFGALASRTIGYSFPEKDVLGVGVEGAFDSILSGRAGRRLEQRIAGNYWKPVNDDASVEPIDGKDVITTIDINIQDVAHNALLKILKQHSASHGTAVLMEVKTGEILAITNLKRASNNKYYESYNFAVGEKTEPGSTFKLPALMVALQDGCVDLDDSVNTGKGIVYYHNFPVRDSKRGGHGKITVQQVFEMSSNIGMSKIITKNFTGREKEFVEGLYRMHLNQKTGIKINGEVMPYIKYPGDKLWSGISLALMSYGYELQMTPLQILMFYNAVANNGVMVRPKLIKAIEYHGSVEKTFKTEIIDKKIASPSTIRKAKIMLEGVVEHGTARNLANLNYKIAGKTGTAQIANKKYGYKYKSQVSYQASFVGYFPAENPKYSCIVVVNEPSNSQFYGNVVAGPVFREIADKVYSTRHEMHTPLSQCKATIQQLIPYSLSGNKSDLEFLLNAFSIPYTDISSNTNWVVTTRTKKSVQFQSRYIKKNLVPNVVGMGVADALSLLENVGLNVSFTGRGVISSQSLKANSRYINGQQINLTLSNNY